MTDENNKELPCSAPEPGEASPVPLPEDGDVREAEQPEENLDPICEPQPEKDEELAEEPGMPEETAERLPEAAAETPEEPEETGSWYVPPEPVRKEERVRDLLDSIDTDHPRPTLEDWRAAAQKERKRRHRGIWITLLCLLVVGGVVFAAVWPTLSPRKSGENSELEPQEGDSASSIVDIIGHNKTTIPRCQGDPAVRLTIHNERGPELAATELYLQVNPSVVTVVAEQANGSSIGTGVIMTPDGYIITNAHVISGGRSCWIALDTGETFDVRLVGYDEEEDLAVLKVTDAVTLPAAEFGDSENLQVGERAYAIGNPLGVELRGTLTDGIISAVNRQVSVGDGYMTMIQTTAALNNGNSGGPLINSSGQIVGINTLKMSGSGWEGEATVEGLGFALPSSSVCFVVNDLIATGRFRGVPTIGISVVTTRNDQGGTQVEVYSVEADLGAAEAGVQAGDIILAADGETVTQTADLLRVRRSHVLGDTMTLTLQRGEEILEVEVVLYSNKGR